MQPHLELRAVLDEIVPRHRDGGAIPDDWAGLLEFQRELGARGWSAPAWPVEIGGRALGVEDQIACDAEFGRARAPRRIAVFGTKNVGPTIAAAGTPEQKLHLQRILTAEEVWCQGFSEPDAGSDLAGLRCRAVLEDDHFVVNGTKVWTSIGMWATHCMVLVRTDPDAPAHRGISALLVPLDTPGITRRPIIQATGDSDFAEVVYEDVIVPKDALLGPLNGGWGVTMSTLGYERAGVIEIAGNLISEVESFLRTRRRTASSRARPRSRRRHLHPCPILGWLGERSLAQRRRPARTARSPGSSSSRGRRSDSRSPSTRADVDGLAAIAGDDMRNGRRLVGSRSNTIAGGTTEVMKNIIGERSLGLPREPKG